MWSHCVGSAGAEGCEVGAVVTKMRNQSVAVGGDHEEEWVGFVVWEVEGRCVGIGD